MPFVWVVRTWCSLDTFWEAIRSSKEYDIAYSKPESVLEDLNKIVLKEKEEWKELCESSGMNVTEHEFLVELPTIEQIKSRPFHKFLSIVTGPTAKEPFAQNWFIERIRLH